MMKFSLAERFDKVMDFHSSGRQTVRGYASCLSHPLDAWIQTEAEAFSTAADYGTANRDPAGMGEEYQWQLSRGVFAFLMETASEFLPPYDQATAEAKRVWPALKLMIVQ